MRHILFALIALSFYGLGRWISPLMRGPSSQSTTPALNSEELAYLVRGSAGVIELVVARLVDRAIFEADPKNRLIIRRMLPIQKLSQMEQLVFNSYAHLSLEIYGENGVPYSNLVGRARFQLAIGSSQPLQSSLQSKRLILQPGLLMLVELMSFWNPVYVVLILSTIVPAMPSAWVASLMCGPFFLCLGIAAGGRRTLLGDKIVSFYRECPVPHDRWLQIALEGISANPNRSLDQLRELIRRDEADKQSIA